MPDLLEWKKTWISGRLKQAAEGARGDGTLLEARRSLYEAESRRGRPWASPEMRAVQEEVYRHLIRAERALDELQPNGCRADRGPGGELLLRSRDLTLVLDPRRGGRMLELGDRQSERNLLDCGFLDHVLSPEAKARDFSEKRARELGDLASGRYRARIRRRGGALEAILIGRARIGGRRLPLEIEKSVTLPARGRKVTCSYRIRRPGGGNARFLFGSELRLHLLDAHFNRMGEAAGVKQFSVVDPSARIELCGSMDRPARLWYFPREAATRTSRGIERVYQGLTLICLWEVEPDTRRPWSVRYSLSIEDAGDTD